MLKLFGSTSRRELTITLVIWGVLLAGAITGLLVLRSHAVDIINHIYYVNVTRGSKATVLYAEAEKYARIALKEYQDLNAKATEKVVLSPENKSLVRSLSLYHEAIQMDPRPEFSPERTRIYEMMAQLYEAAGKQTDQLLAHARALLTIDDDKDAQDYIRRARHADPEAPEPLVLLAQTRFDARNLEGAKAALDELYTSSTVTPKGRWLKAQVLKGNGDYPGAVAELQKAVSEEPHNLDFRTDLAQSFEGAGDIQAAARTMATGLADGGWLDPAYLHAYSGYLMKLNDLNEAIRVLVQADKLAPYSGDVQFSLAQAYNRAGKKGQAASALRRATEAKPELQDRVLQ